MITRLKTRLLQRAAVLRYIIDGSYKKFFTAVLIGILSNAFVSISNPLTLKYLFDEGIIKQDFTLFVLLVIIFVTIFTFWRIQVYFYRIFVQKLKVSIAERKCYEMISKYYELPYNEIIKRDQGYFLSRTYDEVISTAPQVVDVYLSLFNTVVTIIVSMVIVLTVSWRASIAIALSIPLVYLVSHKYGGKIKNESKQEKEAEAKLRGAWIKSINSYKITNIFNLKEKVFEKVQDNFDKYIEAYNIRYKSGAKYDLLSGAIMSYAETLAIIAAGYEMLVGRLTFGGYMAYMTSYWMVVGSIKSLFNSVPELAKISGAVERIEEFHHFGNNYSNIEYSNNVNLKEIGFSYSEQRTIENLSIKLHARDRILVLGSNGSGKSTLSHIIAGLLVPSEGKITTYSLSKISAIVYPSEFIPGSVKDNLSFVVSNAEKQRFEELCLKFNLKKELDKDPSELSAGQRKKLEVMMCLVKEADIYIIDEPLAGIDIYSKETVMSEIFRHTSEKILVVVMHGDDVFHSNFNKSIDLGKSEKTLKPILKVDSHALNV